jgi:hypothetical protein
MPTANGTASAVSLEIFPHIERDLCSEDPWLILHKARPRVTRVLALITP